MEWAHRCMRRLRLLLRTGAVERSMDDEMRHHIECETAEGVRRGMKPEEARRAAVLSFGGLERFKEEARDARGGRLLEDLASDLRYATRVLRRNPAFTVTSVLTLAVAAGAATAILAWFTASCSGRSPTRNRSVSWRSGSATFHATGIGMSSPSAISRRGATAADVPALRAVRTSPVTALREG